MKLRYDALYDMLRQSNSTHTDVFLGLSTVRWKIFSYFRRPTVTGIDATYDSVQQQLVVKVEVSPVLKGRYELQIQKQDSAELMVLDISEAIGRRQTFNISLEPGNYHLTVLELGQSLAIDKDVRTSLQVAERLIIVQDIDCSSAILRDTNNLLYALKQPAHIFQKQSGKLWSPFQNFLNIRDTDRWVKENGFLPAWCITAYRLRATSETGQQLFIEPEVSSHKGTQGIGRVKIELEDGSVWAYARWDRALAGGLYIHKSHLRLFFPPREEDAKCPYSWLDEWDLWPAYCCSQCGEIIGSRSGSFLKVSPSLRFKHRHGKVVEIFYDIGNSPKEHERLLVTVLPDLHRNNNEHGESLQVLSDTPRDDRDELHTSNGHRWARSQANTQMILQWEKPLESLRKWILDSDTQDPMVAASKRMLHRLHAIQDYPSALVLSLALLLRSEAYSPRPLVDEMRTAIAQGDSELSQVVSDIANYAPELFGWALYWVELFHMHTLS